jgi:puromycin-sensitive aminopeptidase
MAHPTADKNYRLSPSVRSVEYRVELSLDPEHRAFEGTLSLDLDLVEDSDELVLHALGLELSNVVYLLEGKSLSATSVRLEPLSETAVLAFGQALPKGKGRLELAWRGRYTEGLRGLYLSGGNTAVTQFESAEARRVIPCLDEPGFKARWAMAITAPEGLTVLSNGRQVKEEPRGTKVRRVFETTEVLSSYLVALACGPLVSTPETMVQGVPVRTWTAPDKKQLARFGHQVACEVLPLLADYFGLPYAFGKLDQVGLVDFEGGAMENAGLITYREAALLVDAETGALANKKRIAEVITHELAHQWFGNWVTMRWWDDLWLNEAFATWMAYKVVDQWRPQWRIWLDYDDSKAGAMQLDALRSTHPVRSEIANAQDSNEAFDLITYEKGGGVLRMIEAFLGEEAFRAGIRTYMRKYGRANAVADDLWNELAKASSQPVREVANAWINQGGFPLLTLKRSEQGIELSQERFFLEAGQRSDELWPVPVVLRWADASGLHEQALLLEGRRQQLALSPKGELRWLVGNARSSGFYRVAYEGVLADILVQHVQELEASERIGLLSDSWALVRSGRRTPGEFLDLASTYRAEKDSEVLAQLVLRLNVIRHRLVGVEVEKDFESFVQGLFAEHLATLGWESAPDDTDEEKLRRAVAIRGMGVVGRSRAVGAQAVPYVRRIFEGEKQALDTNLHEAALKAAMRDADEDLLDRLLLAYKTETDPAYRRRYLHGVAAVETPSLLPRIQALFLDERLQTQDMNHYLSALMMNGAAAEGAWTLLKERWHEVLARLGNTPTILRQIAETLGSLRERRHLDELRDFFKAHPVPGAKQAMAQTLERLSQEVAHRERAMPEVTRWLKQRSKAFG